MILASQVIRALQGSFAVWVPAADSPALKMTVKELRAGKLPYLAIVHLGEKNRKLSVKSIHHFKVRRLGSCSMVKAFSLQYCMSDFTQHSHHQSPNKCYFG